MDDGNGLTPISLAGEYPVAELVICLCAADTLFLQVLDHLFLCISNGKSVEESGVYKGSGGNIGVYLFSNGNIASCNDLDDGHIEFLCEVPVSLIMCGNGHDSTGSVAHKYIVGDPDGDLFFCNGVGCSKSLEAYTCLVLCKLCTLKV